MSKRVEVGKSSGQRVYIDLKVLVRTRALITANSGGGKSWFLRLMAEQLFGSVPVWIVDPEGEFATLREKYGYFLVGKGGETPADPRSAPLVAQKLRELNASAVFDLYDLKPQTRHSYVRALFGALMNLPKNLWRPLILMLDEAHVFAPEKGAGQSEAFAEVQDAATRGRKRGICLMAYTQRLAKISKNVTAELLNRMVGMTREGIDIDTATDVLSISKEERQGFRVDVKKLDPGTFYAMGPAISNDRILFNVGSVKTTHPEVGEEISDTPPPAPEKIRSLLPKLADLPKEVEEKARSEEQLRSEIRSLKAQLSARSAPAPKPVDKNDLKIVEVPIMGKREVHRLEKLVVRIEEAKKSYWGTTTSLENATRDIAAMLDRLKDGTSVNELRKSVGLKPAKPEPVAQVPAVSKYRPVPGIVQPNRSIEKCERAILTVLAVHGPSDIGRIALLSGYRQSGSFKNSLSSLRTAFRIQGENSSTMQITQKGVDDLGDFNAFPSESGELADYWLSHPSFGSCEKKILKSLLENPGGLTIEEICNATGYNASGSFKNSLSSLRTAGVLVGKNNETMRAAAALVS